VLTPFGKWMRKWRVDAELRLYDVAVKLGVTTAFISAIETGKKTIPSDFVARLAKAYHWSREHVAAAERCVELSRKSVRLDLTGRGERSRQLAEAFARTFDQADEARAAELLKRLFGKSVR
jgi:transcriptional regulator with XRE-family HTH domain